jgi:GT2 family glycosyltransferase
MSAAVDVSLIVCTRNRASRLPAFTDDDCYPRADYLRKLVATFEDHPHLGFVGGRAILHDPSDARIGVKESDTPREIPPCSFVAAGLIHGANMAVRREIVATIGGFDPLLGSGRWCKAGEDTDFITRISWAGWTGRYEPALVVAHHHGRKPCLMSTATGGGTTTVAARTI